MRPDLEELMTHLKSVLVKGEFRLASGRTSSYYIDGRKVSLYSKTAYVIGSAILEFMESEGIGIVAGLTMGADPIIGAVITCAGMKGKEVRGLIVRKEPKGHGLRSQIEGPTFQEGERALVVDDVATTGGSILKAVEVLRSAGLRVDSAMVLVDREEGAGESLAREGITLHSLFRLSELV